MKFALWACGLLGSLSAFAAPPPPPTPLLYVSQVPVPGDDQARMTVTSSFANHLPTTLAAPRGGDLMLCVAPSVAAQCTAGGLRNLTAQAGFGSTGAGGFQDANAIAVRDPAVNFTATRAIFSMVVGAPVTANGPENYNWQMYEITNLQNVIGGAAPTIVKVPNQPAFNNIHPNYLSDGTLVFVSDRPRNGSMSLSPIMDEYRGQPTNSGLWKLDPASATLTLLEHTPDGSFSPFVDSFGRIAFVRWDHLMQDNNNVAANSPVDYVSETSATTQAAVETYPEPIQSVAGSNLNGYEINQFFPWTVNQDGTGEETLNHIGRHELRFAVNKTFTNDANLVPLQQPAGKTFLSNFFQMREDPAVPGRYLGVDAPEFGTHSSGQIVAITAASAGTLLNAENMTLQYVNAKQLSNVVGSPPGIGHFRDPLPRADGSLVASFANTFAAEPNTSTATYNFRLVTLDKNLTANADAANSGFITPGSTKTVSYYVGANLVVQTNVAMWELQPVEVAVRTTPPAKLQPPLASPEQKAFAAAGVQESDIRNYLDKFDLALVVMRNVAQRDDIDKQQPYNLHVVGGLTMLANPPTGGTTYDLQWLQFFEADQVRAYGAPPGGINGRRTMPRPLNDPAALVANKPDGMGASPGGKDIAIDGSVAAFMPAQRAMTWQSLSPANAGMVRERYWVEFQKGEIRACDSCHGVNKFNQHGDLVYPAPTADEPDPPQALIDLLNWWKTHADRIFAHDFESCCTP